MLINCKYSAGDSFLLDVWIQESGATSGHGTDAGSADHSDSVATEQCAATLGESIIPASDTLPYPVKSEFEDVEAKVNIAMPATPAVSDANSTAQSDLDTAAADIAKQDVSDVKSEDPALKEDEDAMENDEQNPDGKQSAQYWNYHWPKVCDIFSFYKTWNLKVSYSQPGWQ